jgi:hypothetical protein
VESDNSDISASSTLNEEVKGKTVPSATKDMLSQYELSGFIEKDESISKIEIKGFTLTIVGLSSEFEQKIQYNLGEWRTLLTIIKYYTEPLKIMIGNYKASQEERISKRKLVKVLQKYEKYAEKKIKNTDLGDILAQKSTSKIVKKIAKHEKDSKRYLFEITLPRVFVNYNIETQLTSDDVEHLCNTQFLGWKKYILNTKFRMEFNIHEALPKKVTDKYLSDLDRKKKMKAKAAKQVKQSKLDGAITSSDQKSDDSKSISATTENENSERPKSRRIKPKKPKMGKQEIKNIEQAREKIEFWFD